MKRMRAKEERKRPKKSNNVGLGKNPKVTACCTTLCRKGRCGGVRRRRRGAARKFQFASFDSFCTRTLELEIVCRTGKDFESLSKTKTQKFVDTDENRSYEVLQ